MCGITVSMTRCIGMMIAGALWLSALLLGGCRDWPVSAMEERGESVRVDTVLSCAGKRPSCRGHD